MRPLLLLSRLDRPRPADTNNGAGVHLACEGRRLAGLMGFGAPLLPKTTTRCSNLRSSSANSSSPRQVSTRSSGRARLRDRTPRRVNLFSRKLYPNVDFYLCHLPADCAYHGLLHGGCSHSAVCPDGIAQSYRCSPHQVVKPDHDFDQHGWRANAWGGVGWLGESRDGARPELAEGHWNVRSFFTFFTLAIFCGGWWS